MNKIKTLLVTGSDGFIGERLVTSLRSNKYGVHTFDKRDGDISSCSLQFEKLDHVIHLASLVSVPMSWKEPSAYYRTNFLGTVNVLELCRRLNCSITFISSYVYGTPEYLPVDELHPVQPASPYNHSKFLAEEACRYYASAFGIPVVVFRPGNIFGPGQHPDFLIPSIVRQLFDPDVDKITVSDLRPRRDFLYIDDLIDALIRTIDQKGFNLYNIGSGISFSVEEIVSIIMKEAGLTKEIMVAGNTRKNEIFDIRINSSKLMAASGWKPVTPFEKGIRELLSEYTHSHNH